jgi:uncharacterized membrane protein YhhN
MYVLTDYRMVSKPMIMASLIGFYISTERKQSNAFIMAMIFALFGDIFLMFKNEDFFLLGLGSFLIMQLLYTFTFLKDRIKDIKVIFINVIPVLLISSSIMVYLWHDLGSLQLPVLIYTIAISMMVISALIRRTSISWQFPVIIGVILFMISDAVLAISKFGNMVTPLTEITIIVTYMFAQYLIVRGTIEGNAT